MLPLARRLDPFRKEVSHHVIRTCSQRERVVLPGDCPAGRGSQPGFDPVGSRRIWIGCGVPHHEPDPHGIPAGRGQRPFGGISRAKVGDCFDRHGRVRMASSGARSGGENPLRRRADSQGGHCLDREPSWPGCRSNGCIAWDTDSPAPSGAAPTKTPSKTGNRSPECCSKA